MEHVHHVNLDTGVKSVTNIAAKVVSQKHVVNLMVSVQPAILNIGVIDVINSAA